MPSGGIKLAEFFAPGEADRFRLSKQIGINHAIVGVGGTLGKVPRDRYPAELAKIKAEFGAAGLTIAGVESHPVPAEKIKLGLPGRDEEIENYCAAIQALAQVGIPMVCYNFMAGIGWSRTRSNVPERGGALTTEFDYATAEKAGADEMGRSQRGKDVEQHRVLPEGLSSPSPKRRASTWPCTQTTRPSRRCAESRAF